MDVRRKKQFKAEVSTSSLNDIMFFLLLFFLIVSTMSNPNVIKILLPSSKTAQNLNKQQINLTVTADKKYYINQKEVLLSQIEQELKNQTKDLINPTIILRFDKNLNIQDLTDVLEIGIRMNLRMVLSTQRRAT
jgi:biopolymer transport protein ExbD